MRMERIVTEIFGLVHSLVLRYTTTSRNGL